MRTLALVLLLLATPAYANTMYSYIGDTFHEATGAYALTDRISGSFTLADSFVPPPGAFGNFLSVEGVLGWSFTDGHQTFDQTNSTRAILGWWQDPGADRPTWSVSLANATGSLLTNTIHEWSDVGAMLGDTGQLLGYGRNDTYSPPWTLGTWTVETIQTPELAIIHLPRLLKFGLGLGLEARVTHALQHATAWLAALMLWAPRDGVFIDVSHTVRIEVAPLCSGIATLAFLLGVAGLIAGVTYERRAVSGDHQVSVCGLRGEGREDRSVCADPAPQTGLLAHCRRVGSALGSSLARFGSASSGNTHRSQRAIPILLLFLAAALLALEANALRVVLIALGGEHREAFQYATTALAVGQLVGLARLCRTS